MLNLTWNSIIDNETKITSYEATIFKLNFEDGTDFSCGYFIAQNNDEESPKNKNLFALYFDADTIYQIGQYPTLEDAKDEAQRHYQENIAR